jgi:hypothetical protein
MITVKQTVHFTRGGSGRRRICNKPPTAQDVPLGRIRRISKLMALAIRLDRLLHEGKVRDQSELARLARVTQPRMTQIMNLLHLAPDIREDLVFLPRVMSGNDPVNERLLRPLAAELDWQRQRRAWQSMLPT